jgi:PEP-CTERM motif
MTVAGLGTYQGVSNDVVTFSYDPVDNSFQPENICDAAFYLCLGPIDADLIGDNCYGSLPFPNDCPVSAATSGGYLIITSEQYNTYEAGGSLTNSTPEPATLLLMATGLLGFAALLCPRGRPH